MSRIVKNIVNAALWSQKAKSKPKLKVLLLGLQDAPKNIVSEIIKSGDDYYSFDPHEHVFHIEPSDLYNNLSFDIDFILSVDPYRTLRYMHELHVKVKYPIISIHSSAPPSKKELIFQAAFELEKHSNIILDKELKSKLYLAGAHYIDSNQNINWRDTFYELLLKKS